MQSSEKNSRNFIIMMLFLVCGVTAAKTLHDYTIVDGDQNTIEIVVEEPAR